MFNYFTHFTRCPRLLLLLRLGCEPFSCNIIVGLQSTPFCCCICYPSFLNSSRWEIICSNWLLGRFWFIFQEHAKVRPPCSTSSISFEINKHSFFMSIINKKWQKLCIIIIIIDIIVIVNVTYRGIFAIGKSHI